VAQELIDYYDEEKWGEAILTKDELFDREKKSIKLIRSIEKRKGKLLDVGCGVGFFMDKLEKSGSKLEMHGVDYSPYNLKRAKKLGFTFKRCNIEEGIPYNDGFFDIVYAAELIEHLVNPDYFLGECNRLLKKGGSVIVTTPNLCAWYNRLLVLFGIQPLFYETSTVSPKVGGGPIRFLKQGKIPVGHIRIFTIRAMKDLLESQGFEVTTVKGAHFAALPKWIRWIDDIFTIYPRLSSGMIVVAKKK
jgi:SAM-dependent methyltransferase